MTARTIHRLRTILFIALTAGAASCIGLIGGVGLEAVEDKILPLVPLLIALPALNTMVGDYAGIIAAHEAGRTEIELTRKQLARAVTKAIWVNILALLALSLALAWQRDYIFTSDFMVTFLVFAFVSMTVVLAAIFGLSVFLERLLIRSKLSPSDVLIPVVTSISDTIMLLLVSASVWFIF